MNEENFNRHVTACKYAKKEKKKEIGYFSRSDNVGETVMCNVGPVVGTVSEASANSIMAALASNFNVAAEPLIISDDVPEDSTNTDEVEIVEETSTATERNEHCASAVLCRGYEITMDSGSVLSRYPFHPNHLSSSYPLIPIRQMGVFPPHSMKISTGNAQNLNIHRY